MASERYSDMTEEKIEKRRLQKRLSYLRNIDKRRESTRLYRQKNPEKVRESARRAWITQLDKLEVRLKKSLRSRVRMVLRGKTKSGSVIGDLGCTPTELVAYIEANFSCGMNWENYGVRGWHIDHKKPLKLFNLSDPVQWKEACHYTNLQPMWAADNNKKRDKYVFA